MRRLQNKTLEDILQGPRTASREILSVDVRQEKMITAKPTRGDLIAWWLVLFPLLALIATIPFLLGVGFLQMQHTGKPVPLWEFPLIAIPGILLGLHVSRHLLNRRYWSLTEEALLAGAAGKRAYDLADLDRIIPGIPLQRQWLLGVLNQDAIDLVVVNHRLALVLRFADGTLLPLNLHALSDGTRLMTELVSRFREKLDPEYEFSPQEMKCLRRTEFNLEKKPK